MIKGTIKGTNKEISRVICNGKTWYTEESFESIYESIPIGAEWSLKKISAPPTVLQRYEMRIMEDEIEFGKFDCYSTGGGFYTSQFAYMMDDMWYVYTIENINPTDLIEWCIPADKDIYECIGQEEYMFFEHDMSKDAKLPQAEVETYEYLIMNMSD